MKANHNVAGMFLCTDEAVAYEQRYNKWKQITTMTVSRPSRRPLLPMSKDTINESKSQHPEVFMGGLEAVAYEQRYNKWKQITTADEKNASSNSLLPMSKDTINESKSQQ